MRWSCLAPGVRASLAAGAALALAGGCAPSSGAPAPSSAVPVVHVVVTSEAVTLRPATIRPGIVDFVIGPPPNVAQHAPEGLFFVSNGGDPRSPAPLTDEDLARLRRSEGWETASFDGGWGTAPMRMSLAEGEYAFVLDRGQPGDPPQALAVLVVVVERLTQR